MCICVSAEMALWDRMWTLAQTAESQAREHWTGTAEVGQSSSSSSVGQSKERPDLKTGLFFPL